MGSCQNVPFIDKWSSTIILCFIFSVVITKQCDEWVFSFATPVYFRRAIFTKTLSMDPIATIIWLLSYWPPQGWILKNQIYVMIFILKVWIFRRLYSTFYLTLLRPGIFGKYFLSFPHKNHSLEKTETN